MTADALPRLSRRAALLAGTVLVTGCGEDGSDGTAESPAPADATAPPATAPSSDPASPPPAPATSSAASGRPALAKTSDIPVGGGTVFTDEKVVVTQPAQGEFKAFSAVCTHQGCLVNKVADGTIDCPCHGSKYRIADGSVAAGPAPRPLPAEQIEVSSGEIILT
ncbi:Rieske (2Fe-2S) protein [Streptomyces roseicoloratus]|uniref:Cytochrome bc1 complex Rieske iron-sulfur subunit n=1 Tax=Streptomyces roseicoloratus TaxID=2508722 RepID=A0ABY9S153_9ACTN|nr:Rieske (2Fe-2S) protein [Streptomyces roseicoloratus]WMX47764.1 Rieske (2Fe-2S) protein [Streptomyces roseicoloratus]